LSDLNGLPFGWEKVTLGDVTESLQYGYTTSASDQQEGVKFLRITDIQDGLVNWDIVPTCEISESDFPRYELQEGDFVFARTGSIEKTFLVRNPPKAVFASYLIRGKPVIKELGYWLEYFTKSWDYLEQIGAVGAGTGRKNVNAKNLSTVYFPLPPLNEQKRIAAKIDALMDRSRQARQYLESIPPLLEQFRRSVLAAAFRGDLTRDWREQNPDVEPASVLLERTQRTKGKRKLSKAVDFTKLTQLPKGWIWTNVGDIGSVSGGLTKNSKRNELSLEYPYLRVANVYANRLELKEIKQIKIRKEEFDRVLLKTGDLLVVEGNGSIDQIGRVARWDGSIEPCLHQNHLIKVRFTPTEISSYILLWLLSERGRQEITQVASTTTGLHTLSISKISSLPVPVAPIEEQRVIVEKVNSLFEAIESFEALYRKAYLSSSQIDQSILAKAFRGELVPQDPNDEPASVLLERIKAEREKIAATKKKTKRNRRK
jgi:type I restriction enzyme S subunit